LFWNPTNSISVGRFPNDPVDPQTEAPFVEDDDLEITFTRGCSAAAFPVIDNAVGHIDESLFDSVDFFGDDGRLLRRVEFPRAFVGMVAPLQRVSGNFVEFRIGRISITEAASDGDDVTHDDVICIR
jgi:hypothetical protein